MIYVVATTPMKPENKDDFIKGHKACTAETLKEKGCISYDGHVSVNNPNLYVVVERWETRDDLNAHGRAPHMKVWREYSSQMKTAPTVIEILRDGASRLLRMRSKTLMVRSAATPRVSNHEAPMLERASGVPI